MNTKKQDASVDTSFWINAYRVGVLGHIRKYFTLYVNSEVVREIMYPIDRLGISAEDALIFQEWERQGVIRTTDPVRIKAKFRLGESLAIDLARERGFVLLIDNGVPFRYAQMRGLEVICTPVFVALLFADGELTAEEAVEKLDRLSGLIQNDLLGRGEAVVSRLRGDK